MAGIPISLHSSAGKHYVVESLSRLGSITAQFWSQLSLGTPSLRWPVSVPFTNGEDPLLLFVNWGPVMIGWIRWIRWNSRSRSLGSKVSPFFIEPALDTIDFLENRVPWRKSIVALRGRPLHYDYDVLIVSLQDNNNYFISIPFVTLLSLIPAKSERFRRNLPMSN